MLVFFPHLHIDFFYKGSKGEAVKRGGNKTSELLRILRRIVDRLSKNREEEEAEENEQH